MLYLCVCVTPVISLQGHWSLDKRLLIFTQIFKQDES